MELKINIDGEVQEDVRIRQVWKIGKGSQGRPRIDKIVN